MSFELLGVSNLASELIYIIYASNVCYTHKLYTYNPMVVSGNFFTHNFSGHIYVIENRFNFVEIFCSNNISYFIYFYEYI